ncbi:DoxX family protein [Saccharopolyspora sp. WRP15-2]|uniref:DoxX family protein n=1 Tax=Saccharopolyspora oryzae TaxID=2997343 RepID=A0ABT4V1E8_9PSEU|nr:DoxX family protein [Saccharopolyspora oryzae]MDA3627791.1 DoxX family protein [Saccharopolyspora oryzae]
MHSAYIVVTLLAITMNAGSAIAGTIRRKKLAPAMRRAGVPESWIVFPINTLKLAGALGLLLGLVGVPLIGLAAAIGLVLFYVCAVHTHLLSRDYSPQLGLASGFLAVAASALALALAA